MNKNIVYLWLADSTSIFGSAIYALALTLLSLEFTNSVLGAGAVLFTSVIPYFFLGIIGGVVSDRVDRKKLMLVCDVLRGVLTLSIPIAYVYDILTVQQLVITSVLITCLRAFFFPANQASVPILVDNKEDLNKVNSYIGSTQNLSIMLGPSLGGILLLFDLNVSQLLYIDALSYFISAFFILLIKFPKVEATQKETKPSILKDALQGLKFMSVENKGISIMMMAFAAQLLVGAGVTQLGIPKILESFNMHGEKMFGFVLSTIAFSGFISSLWLAKRKVNKPVVWIFTGYGIRGLAFLLLGLSKGMIGIVIASIIIGFANTISGTILTTVLQLKSPNNMLGKIMAVRSSIGNVADAFAYIIIGGVLSIASIPVTFTVITIYVLLTTALFSYMWFKNVNKEKHQKYSVDTMSS